MNATDTIKEALREYVGDGDGADEQVLAEHDASALAKSLDVEEMAKAQYAIHAQEYKIFKTWDQQSDWLRDQYREEMGLLRTAILTRAAA